MKFKPKTFEDIINEVKEMPEEDESNEQSFEEFMRRRTEHEK